MADEKGMTRRDSLRWLMVGAAAAFVPGCKKGGGGQAALSCTDTSGLDPAAIGLRNAVKYEDKSTVPGKECDNCEHYVAAPSADACGTCKVVKGPINPKGYCTTWAAKQS